MTKNRFALFFFITCVCANLLAWDDDKQLDREDGSEDEHLSICPAQQEILNQFMEQISQHGIIYLDPIEACYRGHLQLSGSSFNDDIEITQETLREAARSILTAPARAFLWAYFPQRPSVAAFMVRMCAMLGFHHLEAYDVLPPTIGAACTCASTVAFIFSTYFGHRLRNRRQS